VIGPGVLLILDETVDALDLGGRGNKLEPLGDDGPVVVPPERRTPLLSRCMTLGRRRGGVAAVGKRLGDGDRAENG
jgi:hypothetical protein